MSGQMTTVFSSRTRRTKVLSLTLTARCPGPSTTATAQGESVSVRPQRAGSTILVEQADGAVLPGRGGDAAGSSAQDVRKLQAGANGAGHVEHQLVALLVDMLGEQAGILAHHQGGELGHAGLPSGP